MMKRRKKGFLALVLCFAFVFGYIPGMKNMVWADGEKPVIVEYKGYDNVPYSFEYDSLDDAFAAMVKLCEIDSNDYDNKDKKPTSEFNLIINADVESTGSHYIPNGIIIHLNKNKVAINGKLSGLTFLDLDESVYKESGDEPSNKVDIYADYNLGGTLEINGDISGADIQSFYKDDVIIINAGKVGGISADAGTYNINGGTIGNVTIDNDASVTISGDALIGGITAAPNPDGSLKYELLLKGGYYATDPSSLLEDEITKDHVTLGEYCVIESYKECTKTEQEEWAKVANPEKYPYRVVDPTRGAIVEVWYNVEKNGSFSGKTKYYKSIADMAKDLDMIKDSLEEGEKIASTIEITLLADITIEKEESYSVENETGINIDLNNHGLTVNGKLVFGCDIVDITSSESGSLVVSGTINKSIVINTKDKVSILAGEYDSIENVQGTLKLTDVKVSNLCSGGGETNVTDCTIKNLMITIDGVVSVFGDTKVEVVEFGKEDEAEAEFAYTLNLLGGYFGNTLGAYAEADEKSFEKHVALGDDLEILDYQDEEISDTNKKEWAKAEADPETYRYHVAEPLKDEEDVVDDDDDDDEEVVNKDQLIDDDEEEEENDSNKNNTNDGKKVGKKFTVSGPSSIILGEGATYTIKSDGEPEDSFEQYIGTDADGNSIPNTAKKGSTIITISADELAKLGSGKHTLTFKFKNGSVSTTLMINEPAKDSEVTPATDETKTNVDSTAQTGDSFDPVLVTVIMLIALGSLAGLAIYKKKEDNR
jgi:hypothetical protein